MATDEEYQAMAQRFAQLSDPHLSTLANVRWQDMCNKRALGYLSWRHRRRFEHRAEVLHALEQDLADTALEQLLITGDLTHIGLPQEFAQARDWLRTLGDPNWVALVPGNHDACVAAPWQETFALWQPYMTSDAATSHGADTSPFPSLRIRDKIAFIGLSTACPKPPLLATGTLGTDQLFRLSGLLKHAQEQDLFRVVYLHHCPIAGQEKWRKRLTDAPQIQTVLEEYGAELVLHGHGHRAHYSELHTRHGKLPVIAVPSASALGLHGADIAHYNRYEVERTEAGWQIHIEVRRYEAGSGRFTEGDGRTLRIDRR